MFGLIVAGRLVQTDFRQVNETKFVITIPDADNTNHIVVFMTGQIPFPEGMGGGVYFCWPNPAGPSWQLLGILSNEKPSAVFKVAGLKNGPQDTADPFGQLSMTQSHEAQIGVSVEPLVTLSQQTPVPVAAPSSVASMMQAATKMLEGFVNYTSSFALTQAQMTPNPTEMFVPLSTMQSWYENFQKKLQLNPQFLLKS